MAFYYSLDKAKPVDRRIAQRLLLLKEGIRWKEVDVDGEIKKVINIPEKTVESTLLIATWNVREFESKKHGPRSKECLFYIAEIISSFDLVAVQEAREDLTSLYEVMKILGSWWKYLITDVTRGTHGNDERIAFLYDTRKVSFGGLAGEIVIPPLEEMRKTIGPSVQLYRTPFIAGFRSAWFKFEICSVHIVYGDSKADDPARIKEIEEIAKFLAKESKQEYAWANNWILLGDFNIFKITDATFKAITDAGFIIPVESRGNSNVGRDKCFDQIAFILEDKAYKRLKDSKSGVFDYYDYIYKLEDESIYAKDMGDKYKQKTSDED